MTYMQKIDGSAIMRELTEYETTLVSGGFGNDGFDHSLPDSAILGGFTTDDIRSAEVSFDPTTNELVTTLFFAREDDFSDLRGGDRSLNDEYGARPNSGQTVTRQTVTEGTSVSIGVTSVRINVFSKNLQFNLPTIQITGPRTVVTVQRTTVNGQPLPPPPPVNGCNNGNTRHGGGCIRPN